MNLYEINGSENNPVYQELDSSNNARHYDFLHSVIRSAIDSRKPWLSESFIKAVNFHAIVGLHDQAGQYRTNDVFVVQNGALVYEPPKPHRVNALMEDFVDEVNWHWQSMHFITLAAYALWRVNHIHPFVNGNGRTARAICYFILCVKHGGPLPGTVIVPDIIRQVPMRARYESALESANQGNLADMQALVTDAVRQQLSHP